MKRKVELWKLIAPGFNLDEENHLCNICLDIKVEPVKCATCKSTFCKYCATKWKAQGNVKCPNRCSETWSYSPASPLEIKLQCMYECGQLEFPDQFLNHTKSCSKNPYLKSQEEQKFKYLCDLNHQLVYISDPRLVPLNIQCASCEVQKSVCRSACIECKDNGETYYRYCCQCRIPKGLTKTSCPKGHANFYIKPKYRCTSTICDVCSVKILQNGNVCVEDKQCDFAMCVKCYKNLQNGEGEVLDVDNYVLAQSPSLILPNILMPNLNLNDNPVLSSGSENSNDDHHDFQFYALSDYDVQNDYQIQSVEEEPPHDPSENEHQQYQEDHDAEQFDYSE